MRQLKMQLQPHSGKAPPAGLLFTADSEAADDAMARGVFGAREDELEPVLRFLPETPCFMYRLPDKTLHGVFRATGGYELRPGYQPDPKLRGASGAAARVSVYRWWDCINPLQGPHLQYILGMSLSRAAATFNPSNRLSHARALTESQVCALLAAFSELNPGVESRHMLGNNAIGVHNGPSPTQWMSDDFDAPGGPHSPGTRGIDAFGGVLPPNPCRASPPLGHRPHAAAQAYGLEHARRFDQTMPDGLILPPDQAMPDGLILPPDQAMLNAPIMLPPDQAMPNAPVMLPDGCVSYVPRAVNGVRGIDYGRNALAPAPCRIFEPGRVLMLDPHVTSQRGEGVRSVLCYATGAYDPDCLDAEADGSKLEIGVLGELPEDFDEMVYGGPCKGRVANRGAFSNPHPIMWDAQHEAAMGMVIRRPRGDLPGVQLPDPWNPDGDDGGNPFLPFPEPGVPLPFATPTTFVPAFPLADPHGPEAFSTVEHRPHRSEAVTKRGLVGSRATVKTSPREPLHDVGVPTTLQVANIPGSVFAGTAPTLTDVFAYLDLGSLRDSIDFIYLYDVPAQRADKKARLTMHVRLVEDAAKLHQHLTKWQIAGRKPGSVTLLGGVGLLDLQKRYGKRAVVLKGPPSSYDFSMYDARGSCVPPVPVEFYAGPVRCFQFPLLKAAGIYPKSHASPPAPAPNASSTPQSTKKRTATAAALPDCAKTPAKGGEGKAVPNQAPTPLEAPGVGPNKKPRRDPIVFALPDEPRGRPPGPRIWVKNARMPGTGVEPGSTGLGKAQNGKGGVPKEHVSEAKAININNPAMEAKTHNVEGRPATPPRAAAPGPQTNRKQATTPASLPNAKRRKTPIESVEALGVGGAAPPPIPSAASKEGGGPFQGGSAAPPIPSPPSKEGGELSQKPARNPIVWIPPDDSHWTYTLRTRVKHAVEKEKWLAKQRLAAERGGAEGTCLHTGAGDGKPRGVKGREELKPTDVRKTEHVSPHLGARRDMEKRPPSPAVQKLECVRAPLSGPQGEGTKTPVDVTASAAPPPAANGTASRNVTASKAFPSANGHAVSLPATQGCPGPLPECNGADADGTSARPEAGPQLEGVTPPQTAERKVLPPSVAVDAGKVLPPSEAVDVLKVLPPSEAVDAGQGVPDGEGAPECDFGGDFIALE